MNFPMNFISASGNRCTLEKNIPAPYFRKNFLIKSAIASAELLICGLGFYELFVNGSKITKGKLAPYISNPDHIIYYDSYDISEYLKIGENVIGVQLGNGRQNNFGGFVWDFQLARWIAPPCFALQANILEQDKNITEIISDESFVTHPSPIIFDDLHCGEDYDARLELDGWSRPDFDDSGWENAVKSAMPRGEAKLCSAHPIAITQEIKPVSVIKEETGYRYDFGINSAGFFRLNIKGKPGQKITLSFGEEIIDNKLYTRNLRFHDDDRAQVVNFICSGKDDEYTPSFTYFGYRYILVEGLDETQAQKSLLTMLVAHSAVDTIGSFNCSDDVVNTLQTLCKRSSLDNLFYFPTDCPHREKNGWTGDSALSCEQMLLNFTPEKDYAQWLANIRKAQRESGQLPGIIPTGGWGYHWGNGPAWDSALFILPYMCFRYRGDKEIIKDNAEAFIRWIHYIMAKRTSDGVVECGLGDWLQPSRDPSEYITPLAVTDTLIAMRSCTQAAEMFAAIGMLEDADYANACAKSLKSAFRKNLLSDKLIVQGRTQTAQAMAIAFGIFDEKEKPLAFSHLLDIINETGNVIDTGMHGGRILFEVLADNGEVDLAYKLITQDKYPSFADWIKRGATTLWEDFSPEGSPLLSHNHHCWSFISGFFYTVLAGLRYNPNLEGADTLLIAPRFPTALSFAEAEHKSPIGRIFVRWERIGDDIALTLDIPQEIKAQVSLPTGYRIADIIDNTLHSGRYLIKQS